MKNKDATFYELMGFIKDDKAPKQIKDKDGIIYTYDSKTKDYYTNRISDDSLIDFIYQYGGDTKEILNYHLEILPEENDEWEDICELLDDSRYNFSDKQNGMTKEDRRLLDSNFKTLGETINKIIKNQKYLKEKLNNYDRED